MTGKRKKTDADHEEMARLEFLGSLYLNEKGVPVIPGDLVTAMICESSKAQKLGKVFKAQVFSNGLFPLEYKGPKTAKTLWEDPSFRDVTGVVIQRNRIMRTRPKFTEWAVDVVVDYFDGVEREEVIAAMERAGALVGLCDWRPRYGRFEVEVLK